MIFEKKRGKIQYFFDDFGTRWEIELENGREVCYIEKRKAGIAVEDKQKKSIEEVLNSKGVYVSTTSGVSMRPLFYDRRDTVIISPVKGRLQKYDLPLYKRGDRYILHRVIKVLPDSYVMLGDNCVSKEYGITDADIVGVMTAYYRKDRYGTPKDLGYRLYVRFWYYTHPIRIPLKKLWWKIRAKKDRSN